MEDLSWLTEYHKRLDKGLRWHIDDLSNGRPHRDYEGGYQSKDTESILKKWMKKLKGEE